MFLLLFACARLIIYIDWIDDETKLSLPEILENRTPGYFPEDKCPSGINGKNEEWGGTGYYIVSEVVNAVEKMPDFHTA